MTKACLAELAKMLARFVRQSMRIFAHSRTGRARNKNTDLGVRITELESLAHQLEVQSRDDAILDMKFGKNASAHPDKQLSPACCR